MIMIIEKDNTIVKIVKKDNIIIEKDNTKRKPLGRFALPTSSSLSLTRPVNFRAEEATKDAL